MFSRGKGMVGERERVEFCFGKANTSVAFFLYFSFFFFFYCKLMEDGIEAIVSTWDANMAIRSPPIRAREDLEVDRSPNNADGSIMSNVLIPNNFIETKDHCEIEEQRSDEVIPSKVRRVRIIQLRDVEDELATLNMVDEEEDVFCEDASVVDNEYKYCLVGLCLIDSTAHFLSLRNTIAELWHPIGGVFILDLREKRYLFYFFHDIDINRVLAGTPWFFNNHLLILHKIQPGEDPVLVPLSTFEFWIQIHDLPTGMMTEAIAKQFGTFLG
ncbi:hypothetical protein J1N35_022704 [Gossypium stocksii]|uniref:DUF4283 domain-containing protein n=1 Tax=Gossypium stocksii TaxID=47602 RepID=A0A9D4A2H2_9ROSI|nr:hypothetical protein J1N35_022704 [Gossypium stocksii]